MCRCSRRAGVRLFIVKSHYTTQRRVPPLVRCLKCLELENLPNGALSIWCHKFFTAALVNTKVIVGNYGDLIYAVSNFENVAAPIGP